MRSAWWILLITGFSLFGGGIFYTLWLATFLVLTKNIGANYEAFLRLLSPIVTALGFTFAVLITNRILYEWETAFLSVYFWPLA